MNIITAFKRAVNKCTNTEVNHMVRASMYIVEESLRREELKLAGIERLRNEKSSELMFLQTALEVIQTKLEKCQTRLNNFSKITDEVIAKDIHKYEKRFTSILASIEKVEAELTVLLNSINICIDSILNGPEK